MDEQPTSQEKLKAILEKATGVSASLFRNGVISDTLHEATIMQVMAAISMSHPGLTADQLVKIRTTVESMATRSSHADMLQTADAIAREYILENDEKMQSQTPQQMTAQLWTDYQTRDKENADEFEKLYHNGVITSEQISYIHRERQRLNQLPLESDERLKGEWEFIKYQHNLGLKAAVLGDDSIIVERASAKILENIASQKAELDAILAINVNARENCPITTYVARHTSFDETTDVTYSGLIKMEFYDVTNEDVKVPIGSKERFSKGLEK